MPSSPVRRASSRIGDQEAPNFRSKLEQYQRAVSISNSQVDGSSYQASSSSSRPSQVFNSAASKELGDEASDNDSSFNTNLPKSRLGRSFGLGSRGGIGRGARSAVSNASSYSTRGGHPARKPMEGGGVGQGSNTASPKASTKPRLTTSSVKKKAAASYTKGTSSAAAPPWRSSRAGNSKAKSGASSNSQPASKARRKASASSSSSEGGESDASRSAGTEADLAEKAGAVGEAKMKNDDEDDDEEQDESYSHAENINSLVRKMNAKQPVRGSAADEVLKTWKKQIDAFEKDEKAFYRSRSADGRKVRNRHNSLSKSTKMLRDSGSDSLDSSPSTRRRGNKFEVELSNDIHENAQKYQEEHQRIVKRIHREWARKFKDLHKENESRQTDLMEQISSLEELIDSTEEYRLRRGHAVAHRDKEMKRLEGAWEDAVDKLEDQKRVTTSLQQELDRWRLQATHAEQAFDTIQKELKAEHGQLKKRMELKCDHLKNMSGPGAEKQLRDLQEHVAKAEKIGAEKEEELRELRYQEKTLQNETKNLMTEKEKTEMQARAMLSETESKFRQDIDAGKTDLEKVRADNLSKERELNEMRFQLQAKTQEVEHLRETFQLQLEHLRIKNAADGVKLQLNARNSNYDFQLEPVSDDDGSKEQARSSIGSAKSEETIRMADLQQKPGLATAVVPPAPAAADLPPPVVINTRFAAKQPANANTRSKAAYNHFALQYGMQNSGSGR